MGVHVPRLASPQTSVNLRWSLVGLAATRGVVAGAAVLLAPWLYREHAAVLVLMRPTKEVFLFGGFLAQRGDVGLPVLVLAALPILLGGVWIFFGLVGAWTGAIRHHMPEFQMKLTWRDLGIIAAICITYVFVVLPLFLKSKGEM